MADTRSMDVISVCRPLNSLAVPENGITFLISALCCVICNKCFHDFCFMGVIHFLALHS